MSTEDLFDDAELEGLSPSRRKMILRKRAKQGGATATPPADDFDDVEEESVDPVSYTHLTLPTKA